MKPYYEILDEMYIYISSNIAGGYEIKFLPYSGGLNEQPYTWFENVSEIVSALNSMK
ncbi:MAG: hypothetical protein ACRC0G_16020 [Fusobacteriaceae bacterium]